MTDQIRIKLLPPIWGIISEYFHDVELRMMSELALMPGERKCDRTCSKQQNHLHKNGIKPEISEVHDVAHRNCTAERCSVSEESAFMYEASAHACINVIEWRLKLGTEQGLSGVINALKTGAILSDSFEMLDWVAEVMKNHNQSYTDRWEYAGTFIWMLGCKYKKNNTLKWIIANMNCDGIINERENEKFAEIATGFDNLEILKLYYAYKLSIDPTYVERLVNLFPVALNYGSPPMLDWFRDNVDNIEGSNSDISWYSIAAAAGKIPNLDWLEKHKYEYKSIDLLGDAGTVEAAQWFRKRGFQWSREAPETHLYATDGKINMLEYAVSDGCPWDDGAYAGAATNDHLEVMQWAVARGYPLDAVDLLDFLEMRSYILCPRVRSWLKTL